MKSTISLDFFTPFPCVHNIFVMFVRKFWVFEIFSTPYRFCVEVIYGSPLALVCDKSDSNRLGISNTLSV